MMKKILVTWVAFAIVVLLGINIVKGFTGELSDEEIMNKYITEEHGEQCYGTLLECDDECIRFEIYENGCPRWYSSINRNYYQNYYD